MSINAATIDELHDRAMILADDPGANKETADLLRQLVGSSKRARDLNHVYLGRHIQMCRRLGRLENKVGSLRKLCVMHGVPAGDSSGEAD